MKEPLMPLLIKLAKVVVFLVVSTVVVQGWAQQDPIRVGHNLENPPWEFVSAETGQPTGFGVDLYSALEEALGRPVTTQDMPFTGLFPALLGGRIDLVGTSITVTAERLQQMDFTQPFYESQLAVLARSGGDVSDLNSLRGKIVAVQSGTTASIWAAAHEAEYGFETRLYDAQFSGLVTDITAQRADAAIVDATATDYYLQLNPQVRDRVEVAQRIETGELFALAFRKNDPIRDEVNAAITQLKESGELARIYEEWFGNAPAEDSATVQVMSPPRLVDGQIQYSQP
jgi:polar amino acid transport system substrate-binding protein